MDDASAATIDDAAVKPIREVLDAEAFVPADVVELARWTAEYYAAGPGDTITRCCRRRRAAAAPTRTRPSASRRSRRRGWILGRPFQADAGEATPDRSACATAKQREALELLGGQRPTAFRRRSSPPRGIAADVVARLVRHGFVSVRQDRVDRDPFETAVVQPRGRSIPPGA